MSKKSIKFISLMLIIFMAGSMLIGCNNNESTKSTTSKSNTTNSNAAVTQIYPVKTDVTLKYWGRTNPNLSAIAKSRNDTPFAKEFEKRTGIKVEYIHPTVGQESDILNLMIASMDLPDIIEYNWMTYPGGITKAIDNGIILPLKDVYEKYAPNLKKYLAENPAVDKMIKTDDGSYYIFPAIRGDVFCMTFQGPIFRNDWLKDLSLQVPTTIDEWTKVLTAFKKEKKSEAPLTGQLNGTLSYLSAAYGAITGFYVEDSKVRYGSIEPGYKDYIKTLSEWYSNGLLDKNFSTLDFPTWTANMTSGKSGATIGYAGGHLGTWITTMKDKDPKYDLIAGPFPTLKKGEKPKSGQLDAAYTGANSAIISGKSKNVELAARFLDFGYSKEGNMLYNYGIEGETYSMKGGYPKFTDLILNNPEKLSLGQAAEKYLRASNHGPFVMNKEFQEQYYLLKQQTDAVNMWMNTDAAKYRLPSLTFTSDESSEAAKIGVEIGTYQNEMVLKMIMGVEPIESFENYVAQIKKLKIDRWLEIHQNAFNRYTKR